MERSSAQSTGGTILLVKYVYLGRSSSLLDYLLMSLYLYDDSKLS